MDDATILDDEGLFEAERVHQELDEALGVGAVQRGPDRRSGRCGCHVRILLRPTPAGKGSRPVAGAGSPQAVRPCRWLRTAWPRSSCTAIAVLRSRSRTLRRPRRRRTEHLGHGRRGQGGGCPLLDELDRRGGRTRPRYLELSSDPTAG